MIICSPLIDENALPNVSNAASIVYAISCLVQCTNALQRLEASFVKEAHLEIARGGSAEFADLMRVLVSLYLFITGEFGRLSEGKDLQVQSLVVESND